MDNSVNAFAKGRGVVSSLQETAEQEARLRRRRADVLGSDLTGDPAWDILLEIYLSLHSNKPLSITAASHLSGVAPTTSLRWIDLLSVRGLIDRNPDRHDKRRTWLTLTEKGVNVVEHILSGRRGHFTRPILQQLGVRSSMRPDRPDQNSPQDEQVIVEGSIVDLLDLARECETASAELQHSMLCLVTATLANATNIPLDRRISTEVFARVEFLLQCGAYENAALALLPIGCSYTGGWFPGSPLGNSEHSNGCVTQVTLRENHASASTKAPTLALGWLAAYLRALNSQLDSGAT